MDYIELIINTNLENRDKIIEILNSFDIYTFEEYGNHIIDDLEKDERSWDFVDDKIFNLEKSKILIKTYFDNKDFKLVEKINKIMLDEDLAETRIEKTKEEDWANNWKKYYHTLEIGEKIAIKPYWEDYENNENRKVVIIDPGMAFGTGTHETTYLCLESLEKYVQEGSIIFDIGCGSGILGIAAVKLGAKEAVCVDIDDNCIKATEKNARLNNVENSIVSYKGNLLDVVEGKADVIVSNIIAEIIVEMIPELKNHLKNNGVFISSGILTEKIIMVEEALLKEGFEILKIEKKNSWALIVGKYKYV